MNRSEFTLEQWLSWMEKSHSVAIDLGLERVQTVFSRLSLDFTNVHVITVAGTNGKGSTVAILDAIYRRSGYRTVCYTSPHLQVYNERVRINGGLVDDASLVAAFNAVDQAREGISLTYFEMGTLAALWLVADQQPEVALLEVGLGGRLDAINVVDADVAVVTTIDIDHVDWLGDDREKIGWEKAGIFRKGKPAICGELDPPVSIENYSQELGSHLRQVNTSFEYRLQNNTRWLWQGRDINDDPVTLADLPLPRLPLQNAATALQTILLSNLVCSPANIAQGLRDAQVSGRMEAVEYQGHHFILDVAHNPQSAAYLAQQLKKTDPNGVQLILGMLADKDCSAVIKALSPVVTCWHLATLDVPRGQTAEQLSSHLFESGINKQNLVCHDTVADAVNTLVATDAATTGTIVVAGSFFTVGGAYPVLHRELL
ncbi:bifunctional tetrahydrofolate synthase/dihydrofolate synthase [Neptunomonas japonica]|uniref:Dihydrofolate synthase/folylpolyglutamate synthase n=1 Tax=Neptunomonas japonica JAMM 1380 TaxID=1441457 RepID=A0A7R6SW80_9GAMM|nr:bifunctional tetrahydrofolate synthase/dihydrofolate synthase [Neptunomonas japonica]BBB29432.1 dihydrofolate synthase/folylpolyglutamate synthase [Neptunomonas japonica JAMM 1380]